MSATGAVSLFGPGPETHPSSRECSRRRGPNHAPIALRLASAFRGNKSNQFGNSGVLRLSYLQLLFIRTTSPLELPEHQCKDLERREDLREPKNSQPQTAFAICLHIRPMVGQPQCPELDAITKTRLRRLTCAYSISRPWRLHQENPKFTFHTFFTCRKQKKYRF